MIDILQTPPNIHKKARDTEQLALDFILPKIKKMRLRVLVELSAWEDGLTGSQVVKNINGYIVSVRPRLTELHEYGLIKPLDEKRKNERGMFETVWAATSEGKQIIERKNNE
jgi:hypothetical protein|tara:strand:- start:3933 stop:4268 length:336 start_codon:yes stop_codon:yes gene_type:complete